MTVYMEYTLISPYGALTALAALCAVLLFIAQRRAQTRALAGAQKNEAVSVFCRDWVDPLELALCAIPAALVGARLLYCLVRADFFIVEMGPVSILRTWEGGFLLYGAALGALGAAALLARRRGASIPGTLDEMAAPGLLAVAICRLAERFTTEGVGAWIENPALQRFPFAVCNEYGEWQIPVFVYEALAALLILVYILRLREEKKGERILRALLLYACCQVVFESMRMDSCLRIGFVRVSQVISAVVILFVTALYARRAGGWRLALVRSAVVLVCAGMVGGLEWALDKTPVSNVILYAVMIAVCVVLILNAMTLTRKKA